MAMTRAKELRKIFLAAIAALESHWRSRSWRAVDIWQEYSQSGQHMLLLFHGHWRKLLAGGDDSAVNLARAKKADETWSRKLKVDMELQARRPDFFSFHSLLHARSGS
eukprot:2217307-Amphidinium_carterae.1